jgi:hypothetical protein
MHQRFDVTVNLEKFCKILGTKQAPSSSPKLYTLWHIWVGLVDEKFF